MFFYRDLYLSIPSALYASMNLTDRPMSETEIIYISPKSIVHSYITTLYFCGDFPV